MDPKKVEALQRNIRQALAQLGATSTPASTSSRPTTSNDGVDTNSRATTSSRPTSILEG